MKYEKKYKEAQKWIESIYSELSHEHQMEAEAFFPELKESEDERIREEIIATIHLYYGEPLEDEAKEMLAWLEKQGEKKPADKIEPQFHEGDWVIFNNNSHKDSLYRIVKAENYQYTLEHILGGSMPLSYSSENMLRLWTIQDAKDGDVLACPLPKGCESGEQIFIFKGINSRDYVDNCIEYYCRICDGVFYVNENGYMGTTSSPLYPATKKQRDALFAKMKEAGYEWDAEKKELKKISQRIVSAEVKEALYDKPAWSEEDETKMRAALAFIKSEFPKNGDEEIMEGTIEWLKSLRPQPKHEWSEEDEKMLHNIECCVHRCVIVIGTVDKVRYIDWLNSLKQRMGGKV